MPAQLDSVSSGLLLPKRAGTLEEADYTQRYTTPLIVCAPCNQ